MQQFRLDSYVVDTLMPDLVRHDRHPSSFLVYLHLWRRSAGQKRPIPISHNQLADATGLSKSAVQAAIRRLSRRQLISRTRDSLTAVPKYIVQKPWRQSAAE